MFTQFKRFALTLDVGFMMAESAEIGLRIGLFTFDMSMITTCAESPTFSRTQMNLSDSMVNVLKLMFAAFIPIAVSCVAADGGRGESSG